MPTTALYSRSLRYDRWMCWQVSCTV